MEDFTKDELAEYLTLMRMNTGLSKAGFAKLIGVNVDTYSTYEKGERKPRNSEELIQKVRRSVVVLIQQERAERAKPDWGNWCDSMKQDLIRLAEKGYNHVQIAFRLNIEENVVLKKLRQYNCKETHFKNHYGEREEAI